MLKITRLFDMLAFDKNKSNIEVIKFGVGGNDDEIANKPRKLKSKKLFKFWKIPKSKKLPKIGIYLNLMLKKPDQTF